MGTYKAALERFLHQQGLPLPLERVWVDPRQRPSALCYIQDPGAILLLRRNKPPFEGYWTAPGGKIDPGEGPLEAIQREIREETSLELEKPQLRFIASETGPAPEYFWLLFGFVAYRWRGGGRLGKTEEGTLQWVARRALDATAIPDVDRALLPYVLEPPRGQVYVAHITYGAGGTLEQLELEELARLP